MLNLNYNIIGALAKSNIGAGADIQPTTTTTTTTTSTTTTTAAAPSVRTDVYSASLELAIPGASFPSLGMTSYLEDISQIIRGTGTGYGVQQVYTGSLGGSVVQRIAGPSPKWAANNYSSSIGVNVYAAAITASYTASYNDLNSSSFTIETWVNSNNWNSNGGAIEIYRAYGAGPLLFTMQSIPSSGSNPQIQTVLVRTDGTEFVYTANPYLLQSGSWYHTALVRSGSNYNMLLNGEVVSDFVNSATLKTAQSPYVMNVVYDSFPTLFITASFQDYRIYKGIAKYPNQASGSTYTTPLSMVI